MLETIEQIANAYGIPWLKYGNDVLLLETSEERAQYFLREEGYNVDVTPTEFGVYVVPSKVIQKIRQRAPRFVIRGN